MDEQKTKQEEESAGTVEDQDYRSEPKASSLIDNANSAAERLEAANQKQEQLLNRQEEIYAKNQLAGRAEAGLVAPQLKEDTPEEFAEKIRSGEVKLDLKAAAKYGPKDDED